MIPSYEVQKEANLLQCLRMQSQMVREQQCRPPGGQGHGCLCGTQEAVTERETWGFQGSLLMWVKMACALH